GVGERVCRPACPCSRGPARARIRPARGGEDARRRARRDGDSGARGVDRGSAAPRREGRGGLKPDTPSTGEPGSAAVATQEESIQLASVRVGEEELDRSLRPSRLVDFVGQEQLKEQLALFIEATRARGEPLDHVLLAGPPGLGKTSLAHIIARELEVPLVQTAGPAL